MAGRVNFCESCGAPIDARWAEIVLVCRFCGSQNAPGHRGDPIPPSLPDDGRPRLAIGGRTYVVEGLLAHGDACDVYRGRWVIRLGELVVLKVLRTRRDADLLRREHATLRWLWAAASADDAALVSRLPQPIALGPVADPAGERLVAVQRWQSGYQHDLTAVREAHPRGVDGRIVVWVVKRILELLAWVHRRGVVHGAIIPPHVLVHPRDHGATLVGWGNAAGPGAGVAAGAPLSARLSALSQPWRHLYPAGGGPGQPLTPSLDVAMAARVALWLAGGDARNPGGNLPTVLTEPLLAASLAEHHAVAAPADPAWSLHTILTDASRQAYGPPAYNPLRLPGWQA